MLSRWPAAAMPRRGRSPSRTCARSATVTGRPWREATTAARMSARLSNSPLARTTSEVSPRRISPPPALPLAFETAWPSWSSVTWYLRSATGSTSIWNSLSAPPKVTMSATPGVMRRNGRTVQSCSVRASTSDRPGASSV